MFVGFSISLWDIFHGYVDVESGLSYEEIQIHRLQYTVISPGLFLLGISVVMIGAIIYINTGWPWSERLAIKRKPHNRLRLIRSIIFASFGLISLSNFVFIYFKSTDKNLDDKLKIFTENDLHEMAQYAVSYMKEKDFDESVQLGKFQEYAIKQGADSKIFFDSWGGQITVNFSVSTDSASALSTGKDRKPSEDDLVYTIILQKPQREQPKNIDQ